MLGGFARADENYGDVPCIALFQNRVFVDVDFAEHSAKFAQQRGDGGFGFFAKVTPGTRVERDVAWATGRKLLIFGRVVRGHISFKVEA